MASNVRVGETTDEGDESYGDVQNAESLHMDTELQDSTLSSENFGSIEEDYDLLNAEENLENIQWHEVPTENRQLFISEQRLISPGSTEIAQQS